MVVGIARGELEIQDAIYQSASLLFPPGAGRSTFTMREVISRDGRIDVLILVASTRAVMWAAEHAIRFGTERQCQAAALSLHDNVASDTRFVASTLGVSRSHASSLLRSVEQLVDDERILLRQSQVIVGSLAVEAKVSDWIGGLRQTERYRGMVSQTSIGLPAQFVARVPTAVTRQTGTGLIAVDDQSASWSRLPATRRISAGASMWLLELLLRNLL